MISYTINSDASYSNKFKRAAYAYWVKGPHDFHVKSSGMFRRDVESSTVAELLSFEKALQEVNKRVPLEHRSAIILFVNTDCMWVIRVLQDEVKSRKYWALIRAVQHAAKGYAIEARHVKAHTDDLTEARTWVNDWCDKAAKAEMGKELY